MVVTFSTFDFFEVGCDVGAKLLLAHHKHTSFGYILPRSNFQEH